MIEGDFADRKISAHVDGGRAEGLACADPIARIPIGACRVTLIVTFLNFSWISHLTL